MTTKEFIDAVNDEYDIETLELMQSLIDKRLTMLNTMRDIATKKQIKGFRKEISEKLITQAKLQKDYEKTEVPIHQPNLNNINGIKGFNLLPEPSACDLYFDIESVEDHIYPGGLEYLLGIYYIENDKEKFKALWSHDKEEEKKNTIIFSGIYNSINGINQTNQFNQAEAITKDLNPEYGSIQKLHARDGDLIALCEDKILQIQSNKDLLFK